MVKITLAKWTNPNSGKSSFATELCKYNCHRISREQYFKHKKALWSLTLKRRSQTIHIILQTFSSHNYAATATATEM